MRLVARTRARFPLRLSCFLHIGSVRDTLANGGNRADRSVLFVMFDVFVTVQRMACGFAV